MQNLAAQTFLDSAIQQLKLKEHDTAKINLLNFISSEYSSLQPDTALYFAVEASLLAEEINYKKGLGYALLRQATIEVNRGQHEEAMEKLLKSNEIAEEIEDFDLLGFNYLKISLINRKEGDYFLAIEKILKAIDLFSLTSNKNGMSKAFINIGNISFLRGNYPASLNYYFEALKLLEQLNDMHTKASCLINIGAVYAQINDLDKNLEYTKSALEVFEQIGDDKSIAICLNNIGLWHLRKRDYQNAMNSFLAAYEKYKKVESKDKMVECISNIGYTYFRFNQYSKALEFFNQADSLAIVSSNMDVVARNQLNRALIFFQNGSLLEGKKYVDQGIYEAKKLGNKSLLADGYQLLARIDSASGDFPNALAHFKLYKIYEDSVLFLEKEEQKKLIESRYEDEMSIMKLKYQNEQKSLELIENKKRTRTSYYLFGAVILVIIFAALAIINHYRLKQIKLLSQEKMKNQKEQFKAMINAQENERSRIARDLHDGIGQSMSGMILQFEQLIDRNGKNGNDLKDKSHKIFTTMNEVYMELRNLSHQIMPRALKQVGVNAALSDLLTKTFTGTNINFQLDTRDQSILPEETAVGIYRITQELLTNIIKHAKASEVSVHLFTVEQNLLLIVEDNGIGITGADVSKLEAGIGINNIMGRVNMLNGSFTIEPGPEKGTIATVKIPIKNQLIAETKKSKVNEN